MYFVSCFCLQCESVFILLEIEVGIDTVYVYINCTCIVKTHIMTKFSKVRESITVCLWLRMVYCVRFFCVCVLCIALTCDNTSADGRDGTME